MSKSDEPPPEGPEVKRERVFLKDKIEGKLLTSVDVLSGRYVKKPIEGLATLQLPQRVVSVDGKGKLITINLENNVILSTLGMAGGWCLHDTLLDPKHAKHKKHERIVLKTDEPSADCSYVDIRNFGTLKVVTHGEAEHKLESLGYDMLSNPCTAAEWLDLMDKNAYAPLHELLLNQGQLCGVGNIYRAESLYAAGISPYKTPAQCSTEQLVRLYAAIKDVLQTAYAFGSAAPYIRAIYQRHGKELPPEIEHDTINRHFSAVYGRKTDEYGHRVICDRSKGRTIWWVPEIQK